ncbi:MAG: hypothetical protein AMXMBFR64_34470 [Myxococcales bacterium]
MPFGRYTLLERLAVGGMAEIYRARLTGIGGFEKPVAIKRMLPQYTSDRGYVDMLLDEARIMALLDHANIVQILEVGQVGHHFYLAMELVDGADLYRTLRTLHERGAQLPMEAAAFIVREVLTGLHYAHNRTDADGKLLHIVHRDVSPQNVLLSWEGDVKLIDFGIAKADARLTTTGSGIIKGKFQYMSPEQARGMPLDVRTDVFSAGILLWEALTASPVYEDEGEDSLINKVREANIPAPTTVRPDVPHMLEGIAMRALSVDPDERFQTAAEFHRALTAFLGTRAVEFTRLDLSVLLAELMRGQRRTDITAPFSAHDRQLSHADDDLAMPRTERRLRDEAQMLEDRWIRALLAVAAGTIVATVMAIAWVILTSP